MLEEFIEVSVLFIEGISVVMIVLAVLAGVVELVLSLFSGSIRQEITTVRLSLAERFVLALEFLIAADILKTITTPTLDGMAVLGGIIVLRTVLSLSIDYELRQGREGVKD